LLYGKTNFFNFCGFYGIFLQSYVVVVRIYVMRIIKWGEIAELWKFAVENCKHRRKDYLCAYVD